MLLSKNTGFFPCSGYAAWDCCPVTSRDRPMDAQAKVLGLSWLAVGVVYYLLMRLVLKRNVELKLEG